MKKAAECLQSGSFFKILFLCASHQNLAISSWKAILKGASWYALLQSSSF